MAEEAKTTDSTTKPHWGALVVDFIKLPFLVLTIVFALILARCNKVPIALKFGDMEAKTYADTLDSRSFASQQSILQQERELDSLRATIQVLISRFSTKLDTAGFKKQVAANLNNRSAAQTEIVSDNVAALSMSLKEDQKTLLKKQKGWIWIGDYNTATAQWDKSILGIDASTPYQDHPKEIAIGSVFYVRADIILRSGKPNRNGSYFKGVPMKGVLPKGTEVTVLTKAVDYTTLRGSQYWLEVEVQE